jgi:hypothetical protein
MDRFTAIILAREREVVREETEKLAKEQKRLQAYLAKPER